MSITKKTIRSTSGRLPITGLSLSAGVLLLAAGLLAKTPALLAKKQGIPTNPQATATVPPATFATWFQSGSPSLNGIVNPANSITFPNNPGLANVDFYQWSYQMFLWATSPAPATYGGGGGRVFNSPVFYDISPPDAMNNRTFIPHTPGFISFAALRAAQVGFHGLPVITSKKGTIFEVEKPKVMPSGRFLVRNSAGASVEVAKASIVRGKVRFTDAKGKTISNARMMIQSNAPQSHIAQKITINKKIVFFDFFGNVIDTEEGQADGGALLSQGGRLIYYITMCNDVFAYMRTGAVDGGITPAPTQFPTTQAALDKITAYAATKGKTFPDPEALAIELKSSWIEADSLPNASQYITIKATIPTYDKSNPKHWVATGKTTKTLALIGMHVVGSAKGHPEMIWSTFEHFGNTPDATYTYNATSGANPHTITQNTVGSWLFCKSGATNPSANFNMAIQGASGADIVAFGAANIGPTNTIRFKPWGSSNNQKPNPLISSVAASNTQILSMNNSVRGQLISGDVRKNYFFMGATWTAGGASPTGGFPTGNEVGTSQLANSTMETFQITTSAFDSTNNCFFCHGSNQVSVSHVYNHLKPLF
ncbi:MAG: hypothetical protein GC165_18725 [Armatimonadetes bacterium]|nr:hypothetical protein [Armatimonadota bacterium]